MNWKKILIGERKYKHFTSEDGKKSLRIEYNAGLIPVALLVLLMILFTWWLLF